MVAGSALRFRPTGGVFRPLLIYGKGRATIEKLGNRSTLWVILASATLTVMAGSIIAPVLNLIREGLGASPSSAAIIITTHSLLVAVTSPLVGIIIDRTGTKRIFVFGLILYGLAGASGLIINSYWLLIISRAVLGMATAAIFTGITVMILNLYEGAERSKIMGWRASSNSLGGIIWPMVGGALGGFSWHWPFAVYLVGIPIGLFTLFAVPETRKSRDQESEGRGSVLQIFRSRPVLLAIYGLMFLGSVFLYAIVVFLPQRLELIGITNTFHISLFISIMALAAALTSIVFKTIKSRLSYKRMILVILSFWIVGFGTISQTSSPSTIVIAVALYGIGQGMLMPMVTVWLGDIVPASFRGRISSYLASFGLIGQFMSPVIFAPVVPRLGLDGVFLVASAISVVVLMLFLFAMKK